MTIPIRSLHALEAACLAGASVIHADLPLPGHEHARPASAYGVFSAALLARLALARAKPLEGRIADLWAQGFALLAGRGGEP